jgi:hypothetical protein
MDGSLPSGHAQDRWPALSTFSTCVLETGRKLSMMRHDEPTCPALWPDGALHPLPLEQRR